jgi:hypothetical protein
VSEIRPLQICFAKNGSVELALVEIRVAEIGVGEIGLRQILIGQARGFGHHIPPVVALHGVATTQG